MKQSAKPVRQAAVMTHGKPATIGPALARLEEVARDGGVELVFPDEESEKHGREPTGADPATADLAVVLGGDGTMLRGLQRFLGTSVPVIGINFGRVGFLTSIGRDELEEGLRRAFAGEYRVYELPTIDLDVEAGHWTAVNDVVVRSSSVGRMVELAWAVAGEELGRLPCDGVICSTPSGSTGYNLSNGGPVLMWGLDAMAVSFVAPHALDARPLVLPRGRDLMLTNETPDVPVTSIVDGHQVAELGSGGQARVALGDRRSLLATLPEVTFFRRYRETFGAAR
jgi:NAD+ kinase